MEGVGLVLDSEIGEPALWRLHGCPVNLLQLHNRYSCLLRLEFLTCTYTLSPINTALLTSRLVFAHFSDIFFWPDQIKIFLWNFVVRSRYSKQCQGHSPGPKALKSCCTASLEQSSNPGSFLRQVFTKSAEKADKFLRGTTYYRRLHQKRYLLSLVCINKLLSQKVYDEYRQ